jgi:hypothetical protein
VIDELTMGARYGEHKPNEHSLSDTLSRHLWPASIMVIELQKGGKEATAVHKRLPITSAWTQLRVHQVSLPSIVTK